MSWVIIALYAVNNYHFICSVRHQAQYVVGDCCHIPSTTGMLIFSCVKLCMLDEFIFNLHLWKLRVQIVIIVTAYCNLLSSTNPTSISIVMQLWNMSFYVGFQMLLRSLKMETWKLLDCWIMTKGWNILSLLIQRLTHLQVNYSDSYYFVLSFPPWQSG